MACRQTAESRHRTLPGEHLVEHTAECVDIRAWVHVPGARGLFGAHGVRRLRPVFVPTGASWANLVERLFGELDERQLKRLAVNSVSQLIHAIDTYLEHRNEDPTPFGWTKSTQEIIAKIHRGLQTLETLH